MEQLTWAQLGLHRKPVGLLDVEGYWAPLIALARHATEEGFVREVDLEVIAVGDDGKLLLDRLARTAEAPPRRPKWVDAPKP
jgi:Predicted Rossmann fold nucleotide-binding protein